MSKGKIFWSVVGVLIAILGLTWFIQGSDFFLYKFWAPKYANVERKVFEGTVSYNQGMVQELQNMQFDYEKTTDKDAKAALGSVILHRVDAYGYDKLPSDLKMFVDKIKSSSSKY